MGMRVELGEDWPGSQVAALGSDKRDRVRCHLNENTVTGQGGAADSYARVRGTHPCGHLAVKVGRDLVGMGRILDFISQTETRDGL